VDSVLISAYNSEKNFIWAEQENEKNIYCNPENSEVSDEKYFIFGELSENSQDEIDLDDS
jgi:hypothetical protein